MPEAEISRAAARFLQKLPNKHGRRIILKIDALCQNPEPPDSLELKGLAPIRRIGVGGYRIIYYVDGDLLRVPLIGKRNDSEVYRKLRRMMR